jgi:uncharacterized metal-binding protein YceD (DUF177 family)
MAGDLIAWSRPVPLAEAIRAGNYDLEADAATRARIAKALDLPSVSTLGARLRVRAWLDGAEITGAFHAEVEQVCGVSLDPFPVELGGDIALQVVPAGSPNAIGEESEDLELDPDAPDPPDVLEGEMLDLPAYVVEHLALALDPFPRKPGVSFDYEAPAVDLSPFAALKSLKRDGETS